MSAARVLIVDDDEPLRERLARALQARGYDVLVAGSGEEAVPLTESYGPNCALVDLKMPGESGLDLLRKLSARAPGLCMVVLTGYGSIATAIAATRSGAADYLQKPVSLEEVIAALEGKRGPALPQTVETPSLASAEWEHIQRVLADTAGNVTEAARRLGIDRRSLQRKLKRYAPRR
ncbi:MAG: response regulator transcription factor [Myxococcaceae bacterium]